MHKVSVVMSTYETPKLYLKKAVDSILAQTYKNFELIIVCDGSKEEYDYLKSEYSDDKIKLILNKENQGLPRSLNLGIEKSTGKYIARMDSDDISLPNRLSEELDFLRKHNLDICGSSALLFGDTKGKKRLLFNSPDEIEIQLLFRATLIHPTVIGRREVFERYKYDDSFVCSQDFELWSRMSGNIRIGNCDKYLLKYRMHKKQASVEKSLIQRELSKKIIRNNACKITGEYDEKIYKCLWYLSGREKITRNNCEDFSRMIDYALERNREFHKFDNKLMKKILYNRFFEQVFKNGIYVGSLAYYGKVLHLYNITDLFHKLINRM